MSDQYVRNLLHRLGRQAAVDERAAIDPGSRLLVTMPGDLLALFRAIPAGYPKPSEGPARQETISQIPRHYGV